MVAMSKFFQYPLNRFHCSQICVHPGKTCFQAFIRNWINFTLSGIRYYSPLILVPLITKRNHITTNHLADILRVYLETLLASSLTGTTIQVLICILRNQRGKFKLSTSIVIPSYLGSQVCWLFPKSTERIFLMATTQVALEALLRQQRNLLGNTLLNSKIIQTLIFMLNSAIILHYKRCGVYNGFWFIQPTKSSQNEHLRIKNSKYETLKMLQGNLQNYFAYGLGLDILNVILKRRVLQSSKGLLQFCTSFMKAFRPHMTYFFLTYASLYKFTEYLFTKSSQDTKLTDFQNMLAAFVGGLSFIFLNKLTINTFAVVLSTQILWRVFCNKEHKVKSQKLCEFINYFKSLPFGKIIFPLNVTFIICSFVYRSKTVNGLGKNLLNAVTDKRIHEMFSYIKNNDFKTILQEGNAYPRLGVFFK